MLSLPKVGTDRKRDFLPIRYPQNPVNTLPSN
jgi:hypothetical protein